MTTPLTDAEIAEIERKVAATEAGPWCAVPYDGSKVPPAGCRYFYITDGRVNLADDVMAEEAVFIASARSDIPRLISDLKAAREALREVRDFGYLKDDGIWARVSAALPPREVSNHD